MRKAIGPSLLTVATLLCIKDTLGDLATLNLLRLENGARKIPTDIFTQGDRFANSVAKMVSNKLDEITRFGSGVLLNEPECGGSCFISFMRDTVQSGPPGVLAGTEFDLLLQEILGQAICAKPPNGLPNLTSFQPWANYQTTLPHILINKFGISYLDFLSITIGDPNTVLAGTHTNDDNGIVRIILRKGGIKTIHGYKLGHTWGPLTAFRKRWLGNPLAYGTSQDSRLPGDVLYDCPTAHNFAFYIAHQRHEFCETPETKIIRSGMMSTGEYIVTFVEISNAPTLLANQVEMAIKAIEGTWNKENIQFLTPKDVKKTTLFLRHDLSVADFYLLLTANSVDIGITQTHLSAVIALKFSLKFLGDKTNNWGTHLNTFLDNIQSRSLGDKAKGNIRLDTNREIGHVGEQLMLLLKNKPKPCGFGIMNSSSYIFCFFDGADYSYTKLSQLPLELLKTFPGMSDDPDTEEFLGWEEIESENLTAGFGNFSVSTFNQIQSATKVGFWLGVGNGKSKFLLILSFNPLPISGGLEDAIAKVNNSRSIFSCKMRKAYFKDYPIDYKLPPIDVSKSVVLCPIAKDYALKRMKTDEGFGAEFEVAGSKYAATSWKIKRAPNCSKTVKELVTEQLFKIELQLQTFDQNPRVFEGSEGIDRKFDHISDTADFQKVIPIDMQNRERQIREAYYQQLMRFSSDALGYSHCVTPEAFVIVFISPSPVLTYDYVNVMGIILAKLKQRVRKLEVHLNSPTVPDAQGVAEQAIAHPIFYSQGSTESPCGHGISAHYQWVFICLSRSHKNTIGNERIVMAANKFEDILTGQNFPDNNSIPMDLRSSLLEIGPNSVITKVGFDKSTPQMFSQASRFVSIGIAHRDNRCVLVYLRERPEYSIYDTPRKELALLCPNSATQHPLMQSEVDIYASDFGHAFLEAVPAGNFTACGVSMKHDFHVSISVMPVVEANKIIDVATRHGKVEFWSVSREPVIESRIQMNKNGIIISELITSISVRSLRDKAQDAKTLNEAAVHTAEVKWVENEIDELYNLKTADIIGQAFIKKEERCVAVLIYFQREYFHSMRKLNFMLKDFNINKILEPEAGSKTNIIQVADLLRSVYKYKTTSGFGFINPQTSVSFSLMPRPLIFKAVTKKNFSDAKFLAMNLLLEAFPNPGIHKPRVGNNMELLPIKILTSDDIGGISVTQIWDGISFVDFIRVAGPLTRNGTLAVFEYEEAFLALIICYGVPESLKQMPVAGVSFVGNNPGTNNNNPPAKFDESLEKQTLGPLELLYENKPENLIGFQGEYEFTEHSKTTRSINFAVKIPIMSHEQNSIFTRSNSFTIAEHKILLDTVMSLVTVNIAVRAEKADFGNYFMTVKESGNYLVAVLLDVGFQKYWHWVNEIQTQLKKITPTSVLSLSRALCKKAKEIKITSLTFNDSGNALWVNNSRGLTVFENRSGSDTPADIIANLFKTMDLKFETLMLTSTWKDTLSITDNVASIAPIFGELGLIYMTCTAEVEIGVSLSQTGRYLAIVYPEVPVERIITLLVRKFQMQWIKYENNSVWDLEILANVKNKMHGTKILSDLVCASKSTNQLHIIATPEFIASIQIRPNADNPNNISDLQVVSSYLEILRNIQQPEVALSEDVAPPTIYATTDTKSNSVALCSSEAQLHFSMMNSMKLLGAQYFTDSGNIIHALIYCPEVCQTLGYLFMDLLEDFRIYGTNRERRRKSKWRWCEQLANISHGLAHTMKSRKIQAEILPMGNLVGVFVKFKSEALNSRANKLNDMFEKFRNNTVFQWLSCDIFGQHNPSFLSDTQCYPEILQDMAETSTEKIGFTLLENLADGNFLGAILFKMPSPKNTQSSYKRTLDHLQISITHGGMSIFASKLFPMLVKDGIFGKNPCMKEVQIDGKETGAQVILYCEKWDGNSQRENEVLDDFLYSKISNGIQNLTSTKSHTVFCGKVEVTLKPITTNELTYYYFNSLKKCPWLGITGKIIQDKKFVLVVFMTLPA